MMTGTEPGSYGDETEDRLDFTALQGTAVPMHEWFIALLEAGFDDDQAITLMAAVLRRGLPA